jgi:signal transduction histidine kinase
MDGYTFLSRVRMQPKLVHTPFIFLTAHGTQADISRGRTSGVERYIVKPFESAELLTLIKSQLDLSLRRKAYRQEVANRVRSAIFLMFQHELRTPTTFITAYTELLQDTLADLSPADMESVHEFIKGIQVGSRRLTDLIGWLQMVLDLHTGAYAARIQPESRQITGLSALLRATVASFETLANKHGITLYTDIPDNLPPVFGHAPSLTIVFEQLLDNAIKFTKVKQGVREISVASLFRFAIVALGFPITRATTFSSCLANMRGHTKSSKGLALA